MNHKQDRGLALITVILSLAFIFVIAASVVTSGMITTKLTYSGARSHRSMYLAESQLSRAMWDISWDIRQHSRRELGSQVFDEENPDEDEVRFYADGKAHVTQTEDGRTITLVIDDANKGFDFSGDRPNVAAIIKLINLPTDASEDETEPLKSFITKLTDYTDKGDTSTNPEYGAERDYYQDEEGFDLPRNKGIEFAEEVIWIPGVKEAIFAISDRREESDSKEESLKSRFNLNIYDYLKIVPYAGKKFRSTKPNFFSSTDFQIKQLLALEDSELEEVIAARYAWLNESINIEESLDPDLYGKLKGKFSFIESKIYRIRVQVKDSNGLTVNSETVIDIDRSLPRYRENTFTGFKHWRKVNF